MFRTLQVDEKTRALFSQAVVTRVSTTPSQDVLRIYMTSKKLIAKNQLFQLAKQIKKQVFGYRRVQVYIFEKFLLSEQYTPEKLWKAYEDSVLVELEAYSPYKRSLMKNAKVNFPDENRVTVGISNRVYDKEAVDDLIRILDRVFNERCGFRVKVDVEYLEAEEGGSMEKSRAELQQKITFLQENLRKEKAHRTEEKEEEASKAQKESTAQKTNTGSKRKADKPGRTDRSRSYSLRRSDNPDVLYGRDFEEEPITLDQVIEEMGEVTIRGKILNMEERDIRGERTIVTLTISDFTDTIHVKIFTKNEVLSELKERVSAGNFVKLKGMTTLDRFDHELTISSVVGIKKIADFTTTRMDYAYQKRVELHCHTKMSDMDGVTDASVLLKRA